jgi:hypothetical protein
MSDMDIFSGDLVNELLEQAAESAAQSGERVNVGRLTFSMKYLHWVNSQPVSVDPQTYRTLGQRERSIEITFNVDIQELNPTLDFTYERRVILHSTDWFEHWQRSVIEYYDLKVDDEDLTSRERQAELNKLVLQKTKELAGKYVMIADEEQSKQKDPTKVYRTPALVEAYQSKEECFTAYEQRFGRTPSSASSSTADTVTATTSEVPNGFNTYEEFEETVQIMRGDGSTNLEIAKALEVGLGDVARVK